MCLVELQFKLWGRNEKVSQRQYNLGGERIPEPGPSQSHVVALNVPLLDLSSVHSTV